MIRNCNFFILILNWRDNARQQSFNFVEVIAKKVFLSIENTYLK